MTSFKTDNNRNIRVFLSSTFVDMQEERDALAKLFKQLAHIAARRLVSITLLDLRWGVTNDQRRNGQVVSICLKEIDNSRPFFIGLIGSRYGWVPNEDEIMANPELLERFPVVNEYCRKKMSITEMEMRYGCLETNCATESLFLIKSGIEPQTINHNVLINELKESHDIDSCEYHSIDEMVEIVRCRFLAMLDEMYPDESISPEEEEALCQYRVIDKMSKGYVPISDNLQALDKWLDGSDQFMVLYGEPGIGKTATIASWISGKDFGNYTILHYFIGSSEDKNTPLNIQRYIIHELNKKYSLMIKDTPDEGSSILDKEDLSMEVEEALNIAAKHGDKVLLVLEGLNYLTIDGLSKMLIWLPDFPSNVKVLFSTCSSDLTFRVLKDKGYPTQELKSMTAPDIKTFTVSYLAQYGKALENQLVDMIARAELFSNPKMLRVLLDDLIAYGEHESLASSVERYVCAEDTAAFYRMMLDRAEQYYSKELVRDILSIIVLSKNGLSEQTVVEALQIPQIDWSTLYCGLHIHFVSANGKIRIADTDLIYEIYDRYSLEDTKTPYCKAIVRAITGSDEEIDELAWQYYNLQDAESLYDLLMPYDIMVEFLCRHEWHMARYWQFLYENGYSFDEYFLQIDAMDYEDLEEYWSMINTFITIQLNDYPAGIAFNDIIIGKMTEANEDPNIIAVTCCHAAQSCMTIDDLDKAAEYIHIAWYQINNSKEQDKGLKAQVFLFQGNLEFQRGNYDKALNYHIQGYDLAYEDVTDDELNYSLWKHENQIGNDYISLRQYDKALPHLTRALDMILPVLSGSSIEANIVRCNIGEAYMHLGDLDRAEEFLEESVCFLFESLGAINDTTIIASHIFIDLNLKQHDYDRAFDVATTIKESLEENDLADCPGYALILKRIAEIELARNDKNEALKLLKKAEEIYSDNELFEEATYVKALIKQYS